MKDYGKLATELGATKQWDTEDYSFAQFYHRLSAEAFIAALEDDNFTPDLTCGVCCYTVRY